MNNLKLIVVSALGGALAYHILAHHRRQRSAVQIAKAVGTTEFLNNKEKYFQSLKQQGNDLLQKAKDLYAQAENAALSSDAANALKTQAKSLEVKGQELISQSMKIM